MPSNNGGPTPGHWFPVGKENWQLDAVTLLAVMLVRPAPRPCEVSGPSRSEREDMLTLTLSTPHLSAARPR